MLKSYLKQKHQERRQNFSNVNRRMKHVKENCTLFMLMIACFTFFWQTCRNFIFGAPSVLPGSMSFQSYVVGKVGFSVMQLIAMGSLWQILFIYLGKVFLSLFFSLFVCFSNCWICSQTKSPISKIILYLKKKYIHMHMWAHAHTDTKEHTLIIQRTCFYAV